MQVSERLETVPETGTSAMDRKHGVSGTTSIYRDLEHISIVGRATPEADSATVRLMLEHERGHALVLRDIVEGLSADDAVEIIPEVGGWENEKEAWMRSNARVQSLSAVEFVIDCLNSYRRALGVPAKDWLAMRVELGDLVAKASLDVREHWMTYEPPADFDYDNGGDEGCGDLADEDAPEDEDWQELEDGDDEPSDGDDGPEPNMDGEHAPDPGLGSSDPMRWMEPEIMRRVLAGEDVVSLAAELRLPLDGSEPPLITAYRGA